MDRLDRISIWAIAVLLISSLAVINSHFGEAKQDRRPQAGAAAGAILPAANGEVVQKVKLIKNLMETDGIVKAEALLKELIGKYPYEAELYMLMGDTLMRKQEPVRAMHEYKAAIDLNPDYLDKKTPLFQGKKLKVAVGEAMAEVEGTLRRDAGNESAKAERKLIYYLQRKIAGSCG